MTREKDSFWRGISGPFAALTAFFTAVAGLLAVLIQIGVIGGSSGSSNDDASGGGDRTSTVSTADWASDANRVCARANELITGLPSPKTLDPDAAIEMGRQALRINRQMVRDLSELPKPEKQQAQVAQLLVLGARINENTEEILADFTTGNLADIESRQSALSRLGQQFDDAAIDLGASTCAEGASFSGGLPQPGG